MVDRIQYRWDFIGLSTDTKPTPETNDRVANGSTFYCSDNSTLFVWYKDQWYEKTVSGGGGGTSYVAGNGINISGNTISVDNTTVQEKLTAGSGITITNNIISAIGGGGGPTVVQTTGTSTTDVMSQNATSSMVFADPRTRTQVQIGSGSSVGSGRNVAIGQNATASNTNTLAVGSYSWTNAPTATAVGDGTIAGGVGGTAIGYLANTGTNAYSVALGEHSSTSRNGEVNVGTGQQLHGFNSTKYRVIGGVHDPVDAHDAATKGYVDDRLGALTLVSITQTAYDALATKDPNTLYVITGA